MSPRCAKRGWGSCPRAQWLEIFCLSPSLISFLFLCPLFSSPLPSLYPPLSFLSFPLSPSLLSFLPFSPSSLLFPLLLPFSPSTPLSLPFSLPSLFSPHPTIFFFHLSSSISLSLPLYLYLFVPISLSLFCVSLYLSFSLSLSLLSPQHSLVSRKKKVLLCSIRERKRCFHLEIVLHKPTQHWWDTWAESFWNHFCHQALLLQGSLSLLIASSEKPLMRTPSCSSALWRLLWAPPLRQGTRTWFSSRKQVPDSSLGSFENKI